MGIVGIVFLSVFFIYNKSAKNSYNELITHQTSSIIYEKNAYDKFYPASTTKILTAIVVLETLDLNESVFIIIFSVF